MKGIDKVLLSQQVQNIMSTNEINLPDLDTQKTVIFLKVHDEKSTYYPLVNIFMQQLQQSLIAIAREHESLRLNYPFNFIWDEFGNFLSIQLLLHCLVQDVQEVSDWISLFGDMTSWRVHMDMIRHAPSRMDV